MAMKPMIFLGLLALTACQGQPKQDRILTGKADTVQIEPERELEPVALEPERSVPGVILIGGDTVYKDAEIQPAFSTHAYDSSGSVYKNVKDYVREAVKHIHVGKGLVVISFVVSKAGFPCHVSVLRSAREGGVEAQAAAQMDSIACDIIRNMPGFVPAIHHGNPVNYWTAVEIRFGES